MNPGILDTVTLSKEAALLKAQRMSPIPQNIREMGRDRDRGEKDERERLREKERKERERELELEKEREEKEREQRKSEREREKEMEMEREKERDRMEQSLESLFHEDRLGRSNSQKDADWFSPAVLERQEDGIDEKVAQRVAQRAADRIEARERERERMRENKTYSNKPFVFSTMRAMERGTGYATERGAGCPSEASGHQHRGVGAWQAMPPPPPPPSPPHLEGGLHREMVEMASGAEVCIMQTLRMHIQPLHTWAHSYNLQNSRAETDSKPTP